MPRRARIDASGALHHIICRGIERRKIFRDDVDRDEIIRRLGTVLRETRSIPGFYGSVRRGGVSYVGLIYRSDL